MIHNKEVVFFNGLREGVCGHIFECIDYYLFLKEKKVNCGIYLVYDNFSIENFKDLLNTKYTLNEKELSEILMDTLIEDNKKFYSKKIHNFSKVKKFIFTEIHDFARISVARGLVMGINEIIGLRCGVEKESFRKLSEKKYNIKIFQDYRVYGDSLQSWETFNHKKRLLFKKYRRPDNMKKDTAFIYLSTECRTLEKNYIKEIIEKYSPTMDRIIFSVKDIKPFEGMSSDKVSFKIPPIDDFLNVFDTFIYVPLEKKWDCSPRLVAESYLFNKKIIFHDIDESYFSVDKGLFWRNHDGLNDLEDLNLTDKDELIQYIMSTL